MRTPWVSCARLRRSQDVTAIDRALAEINTAWQAASEDMYKKAQGPGQQAGPQSGPQSGPMGGDETGGKKPDGDQQVTDVDFEEVK